MATMVEQALSRPSASVSLKLSRAEKIIAFLLIYFAVDGNFSFLNAGGNSGLAGQGVNSDEGGGPIGTLLHLAVVLPLIYFLYSYRKRLLGTLARLPAIAALTVLPICSVLWSQDRVTSLKMGIYLVLSMLFAVYLAEHLDTQRFMRVICVAALIAAVASIGFSLLVPSVGIDARDQRGGEWEGIFSGKNGCARAMLFFLMPVLMMKAEESGEKLLKYGTAFLILFVIAMTLSRTAWFLTALYLVFFVALKLLGRFPPKDRLLLFTGFGTVFASIGAVLYSNADTLLASTGRDSGLSGRTGIWAALWISIKKRPLLGYGYHAFWTGLTGESANVIIAVGWIFGYAHNGFLAVLSELGAVGLGLFILTFLKALRDAFTSFYVGRPEYVDWFISIIVFTPIYNYTEANIMFPLNIEWLFYVVACVGLDVAARQRRDMLAVAARESRYYGLNAHQVAR
jgi:exopolysaccharide production protein ExoQ